MTDMTRAPEDRGGEEVEEEKKEDTVPDDGDLRRRNLDSYIVHNRCTAHSITKLPVVNRC
jgi:hypothetical protein